jgi:hypothetical protein
MRAWFTCSRSGGPATALLMVEGNRPFTWLAILRPHWRNHVDSTLT